MLTDLTEIEIINKDIRASFYSPNIQFQLLDLVLEVISKDYDSIEFYL